MRAETLIHRAPWLAPMAQDAPLLIEDGAVAVAGDRIVAVGRFAELVKDGTEVVDHPGCVLVPGLVNAHVHLELSHLAELARTAAPALITDWIEALLALRAQLDGQAEANRAAAGAALAGLRSQGVALAADIGNDELARAGLPAGQPELLFFLELLGLSEAAQDAALDRLAGIDAGTMCTAHAPYSVGARLLGNLKKRAAGRGQIFPIHLAESAEEVELLAQGSGPMRDFLEERGVWDGSFAVPGCSPVAYLDRLAILDRETLCVHCVHVDEEDIEILVRRRARICLCPGSNRFLGVGTAPVAAMLAAGLRPALGTDSLASNRALSLWQEMRLLREEHPGVAPEEVFRMATANGAAALGRAERFGALRPGMEAAVLAVSCPVEAGEAVFDFLTTVGEAVAVSWIR